MLVSFLLALAPLGAAKVEVDVPPARCASGVYRVIADDTLHCAAVDRVAILEAQRDFHDAAQSLYLARLNAIEYQKKLGTLEQAAQALSAKMKALQDAAAEACRQTGRAFDPVAAECGAALPKPLLNQGDDQ